MATLVSLGDPGVATLNVSLISGSEVSLGGLDLTRYWNLVMIRSIRFWSRSLTKAR